MIPSDLAASRFGLLPHEYPGWEAICQHLNGIGGRLLLQLSPRPQESEWIGFFRNPWAHLLHAVIRGRFIPGYLLSLDPRRVTAALTEDAEWYEVQPYSSTLRKVR
jgi:hypothetical protein